MKHNVIWLIAGAATLAACGSDDGGGTITSRTTPNELSGANFVTPAPCGAGSVPETGLQGQVSLADRESGRSKQGYKCNMELGGQYQGEGSTG